MIEAIQRDYKIDMILLDVPPIFANDDAIAVAEMADCGLIVASAGQTSIDQIDRAEREMSQYTQVAGVVANKLLFEENTDSPEYY
jgi:Mrp family chromosome partitioning ATPase